MSDVHLGDELESVDILIIGSGFAGIGMGIRLKQSGREDFVILEQASELGGTWRENTYPGCECDVPSYLYSFSFEQNPYWSRMFSPADEIWSYLEHCVDKYDLARHLRFDSGVSEAAYDEAAGRWRVALVDGRELDCRVLISGIGALHLPKLPEIEGLESFAGKAFHSARWDHAHDLTDRRVAVIGTGASAVQFVPKIARQVAQLDLYQRSAAWITPKPNPRISPARQATYARQPFRQRAIRGAIYWALEVRGAGFALNKKAMAPLEKQATLHMRHQVKDPELRNKLTPDYQIGCKRVLYSSDFYPAINRPNVDLVTTAIARVEPDAIVDANGVRREVDTIIFGTGFDVRANQQKVRIVGRDGESMDEVWQREGVGAHLGITVAGFPNLFLLLGPNTGLGHNSVVFMIESQIRYVTSALDLLDETCASTVEVRRDVQQTWLDRVQYKLKDTVWQTGCKTWYLDESGHNFTIWPYFSWQYWLETRKIRSADHILSRKAARAVTK